MPAEPEPFQYVVIRVVPAVEREEFINAGVVLFCRTRGFLKARVALDRARLAALAPEVDPEPIAAALDALARVAAGDPGAGPIAALPQSERFGWLAAPASTVLQRSEIHSGICAVPEDCLGALFGKLVAR
ncbi:MAG TPA: DUF3037 domain-containing protein [Solirubrobacteraceae bacterium]|nr:DUF3037 domain-containing protein [Solirubrobacteraceae bacterium]